MQENRREEIKGKNEAMCCLNAARSSVDRHMSNEILKEFNIECVKSFLEPIIDKEYVLF